MIMSLIHRTLAVCMLMFAVPASADSIVVPDASQMSWAVYGSKVYLRNLSSFDSSWLPCCFNYWFDLTTDSGRAMYAAFLSAKYSHAHLTIWVSNKTVAGPIEQLGDF